MSHHFDSPTAIEDGRIGLCDPYVFGGPAGLPLHAGHDGLGPADHRRAH